MKRSSTEKGFAAEQRASATDSAESRCIDGFFEISKLVESPDMLRGWVEWFRRLNIPCLIEKRKAGYALWRKGDEVGRDRSKGPAAPNTRNIIYSFAV